MLDKLKSLFIVPEGDGSSIDKKQNTPDNKLVKDKTSTNPKVKSSSSSTFHTSSAKVEGTLNAKIMDKLLGVIADNNLEGFDYIEFKNAIKALDKLQMDEKTKFRSAFATAQTIGVTVSKILDSVAFYQKILAKENNEFAKVLNQQVASKVGNKQKEIEQYSKMIVEKKKQMKKLADDIEKHQKHIDLITSKIEKDTVSIEKTRSDFDTTYHKLTYQIKEDVKKIKEYLQ